MLAKKDTLESILFDCQCVLFLIDITDSNSLDILITLFNSIKFGKYSYLQKILIENKIDEKMEINNDLVKKFINDNNFHKNYQISIKNGIGIDELVNQIIKYLNILEKDIPNNFISQKVDEDINSINSNSKKENIKNNAKIIFLGNSMVGKTSLFLRLNKNYYKENFTATIGVENIKKSYKFKNKIYIINFIDTAGQDRFRTITRNYYKNANGIFLVFDLNNKLSFSDISIWMKDIKDNYDFSVKHQKEPIIYLVGNKLDLEKRLVSREEAEDLASFYGIPYFEISCKLNLNIPEMNSRMILECIQNLRDDKEQSSFQVKIEKKTYKKKSTLCC